MNIRFSHLLSSSKLIRFNCFHKRYNPYRWTRIVHELVTYDAPDVLLMQEVETDVFDGPMRHSLERLGYGVLLATEQNWQKEALAYRRERFRLAANRSFVMHVLIEKAVRRWLQSGVGMYSFTHTYIIIERNIF